MGGSSPYFLVPAIVTLIPEHSQLEDRGALLLGVRHQVLELEMQSVGTDWVRLGITIDGQSTDRRQHSNRIGRTMIAHRNQHQPPRPFVLLPIYSPKHHCGSRPMSLPGTCPLASRCALKQLRQERMKGILGGHHQAKVRATGMLR